ncbi:MAG: hypothetical protein JW769_01065 [Parachlamydiales bacterium]|nr:hypothetical protein [Parachlamydiales bacterium]
MGLSKVVENLAMRNAAYEYESWDKCGVSWNTSLSAVKTVGTLGVYVGNKAKTFALRELLARIERAVASVLFVGATGIDVVALPFTKNTAVLKEDFNSIFSNAWGVLHVRQGFKPLSTESEEGLNESLVDE